MATVNFNKIIADLLENWASILRSGNSSITYEQMMLITEQINHMTVVPPSFDREGAIKYLNVSDCEFNEMKRKGTVETKRIQGQTKRAYLKEDLDRLLSEGKVKQRTRNTIR